MTASATHSIHIDAPVQKVFGYIEVPANFVDAMVGNDIALGDVDRNPDGTVNSYEVSFRQLGIHMKTTMTRKEFVPGERIVDHASVGIDHVLVVEPDGTGTKFTYGWDASRLAAFLDAVFIHTDMQVLVESMERIKKGVEALP